MAKRSITVELDEELLRRLSLLGDPTELLARLAAAACEGGMPTEKLRERTNANLKLERATSDASRSRQQALAEHTAADVLQVARNRADEVLLEARALSDRDALQLGLTGSPLTHAERRDIADRLLAAERAKADALLGREGAAGRIAPDDEVTLARGQTDGGLSSERSHADLLIGDQREANENMVHATLRAQDLTLQADEAKGRAEQSERELVKVAEFRELFIGILGHDLRNPLSSIMLSR